MVMQEMQMKLALSCCHSLIEQDGKLTGEHLDKEMYNHSTAKLIPKP